MVIQKSIKVHFPVWSELINISTQESIKLGRQKTVNDVIADLLAWRRKVLVRK